MKMVTAKVRFLTNNLVAELTCKADELKKSLEEIFAQNEID